MDKVERQRRRIKDQLLGRTDRRLLVVEGVDDVAVLRILLNRQLPGWETRWALDHAGGKATVLALAGLEPDWLCLVDQDEAVPTVVAKLTGSLPNLMVLPRFCIESYACVPAEIWPAVAQSKALKKTDGFAVFESELLQPLDSWRRHAALWHTVNPMWEALMSAGFNRSLTDPKSVPDDDAVRARLKEWSAVLDPADVWARFEAVRGEIEALPVEDFMRQKLYAKKFYPLVVHQVLSRWLGQADESKRMAELMQRIDVPADLEPLWSLME